MALNEEETRYHLIDPSAFSRKQLTLGYGPNYGRTPSGACLRKDHGGKRAKVSRVSAGRPFPPRMLLAFVRPH